MANVAAVAESDYDVVVVGAGIGGIYAVHRFVEQGLRVLCIEGAAGVGGVWFHNRYPGARVDIQSVDYCYYFSADLYREWRWTERFATQPELLAYLNHVADRFDLRRHMRFETWVTAAQWDPDAARYVIGTDRGDAVTARFLVMATGNLSAARTPDFEGLESFEGEWVQTSHWPDREVAYAGKRVAVIGTGSSGVQTVPVVAETAEHVHVFQRTPNYSIPAHNGPLDESLYAEITADVPGARARILRNHVGAHMTRGELPASAFTPEQQREMIEHAWAKGGHEFSVIFSDQTSNPEANQIVADFVRERIRATVDDPEVAERLCPWDHPIGTRRLIMDTGYYEAFNRSNVSLVDARDEEIVRITATGIQTTRRHIEVDVIVFALGFHAFTGAIDAAGIRNAAGASPTDRWGRGPRTFLGLMTTGFPNLFTLTGAGSPSVLANLTIENEFHIDFVADLIAHMAEQGFVSVEPTLEAEDAWTAHVAEVSQALLRRHVRNYMVHRNDDGTVVVIPYTGGFAAYVERAQAVADDGYAGLRFASRPAAGAVDGEAELVVARR